MWEGEGVVCRRLVLALDIADVTSHASDSPPHMYHTLQHHFVIPVQMMMKRLQELYDVMQELSEDMDDLARIEKERTQSAVVTLSRKAMLKNEELVNRTGKPLSPSPGTGTPTTDGGDDDGSVARFSEDGTPSPVKLPRGSNTSAASEPPVDHPVPSFSMANTRALATLSEGTASDDPKARAAQILQNAGAHN